MGNRQLFPGKSADELLLEYRQSGSQAPFEEIVRRYAAMVYGVCYRVTLNAHDAEDAVQAVFLSLALQAKADRPIHYIGPWLQKVAHRLALDVRKSKSRRTRREQKLAEMNGNGNGDRLHLPDPSRKPEQDELHAVMQEELSALPAKYRMPLMMHYFGGMNREEMAKELNCKPATLGVRVHRGRAMLGKRLVKRGITIGASLPIVLSESMRALVSERLVQRATFSAVDGAAHHGIAAQVAATGAIALVRFIARVAAQARIRAAVALVLASGVVGALAAPTVVESIRAMELRLRNPFNFNLTDIVRPMLRMVTPSPRAEAPPAEKPTVTLAAFPLPEPLALAPAPLALPAPALAEPHVSSTPAPQPDAVISHASESELRLGPFTTVSHARSSAPSSDESLPVGSDSAPASVASGGAAAAPERVVDGTHTVLALAGGSGPAPETYLLPENHALSSKSLTIGTSGFAYFHQSGGRNVVEGDLVLGANAGSRGEYQLDGGTLQASGEVIGDNGVALFSQSGGTNSFERMAIGNGETSSGTYLLDGDGLLTGAQITVGVRGSGFLSQSGGTIILTSSKDQKPYTSALFGTSGQPAELELATAPTARGTFKLTDGKILFESGQYAPLLKVGVGGDAELQLGSTHGSPEIAEGRLVHTSLVVRARDGGRGTLRGWGDVSLTGRLTNNGRVIADGFNGDHTLDLSSFSSVTNKIENPEVGGNHGWYARRRGAIKLPPVNVKSGTGTYTWGENPDDQVIDLVNSVRFTVHDAQYPGEVNIKLLSKYRSDIPALPPNHHFIGVWEFDPTDIEASSFDFTVRYDDGLAATEKLPESILKFWAYDDGQWSRINDASFFRDTDLNLIGAHVKSLSFFAVSAPEPSGILPMLAAAGGMMLRRRRQTAATKP